MQGAQAPFCVIIGSMYKEDPMAKTFKTIMNTFLVLVLLMAYCQKRSMFLVKKKETSKKKASNLPSRRSGKRSRKKIRFTKDRY